MPKKNTQEKEREIAQAILQTCVDMLMASPYSPESMAARERLAALMYQLRLYMSPPEVEMELELARENLLLRIAPREWFDLEERLVYEDMLNEIKGSMCQD